MAKLAREDGADHHFNGHGDGDRQGAAPSAARGRADPMIAATALRHDLTLVTGNTDHYQRIQAMGYPLQVDNWR